MVCKFCRSPPDFFEIPAQDRDKDRDRHTDSDRGSRPTPWQPFCVITRAMNLHTLLFYCLQFCGNTRTNIHC